MLTYAHSELPGRKTVHVCEKSCCLPGHPTRPCLPLALLLPYARQRLTQHSTTKQSEYPATLLSATGLRPPTTPAPVFFEKKNDTNGVAGTPTAGQLPGQRNVPGFESIIIWCSHGLDGMPLHHVLAHPLVGPSPAPATPKPQLQSPKMPQITQPSRLSACLHPGQTPLLLHSLPSSSCSCPAAEHPQAPRRANAPAAAAVAHPRARCHSLVSGAGSPQETRGPCHGQLPPRPAPAPRWQALPPPPPRARCCCPAPAHQQAQKSKQRAPERPPGGSEGAGTAQGWAAPAADWGWSKWAPEQAQAQG